MAIAYATLDYILERIKCRTLFATHYHELEDMLLVPPENGKDAEAKMREGVEYWCTDVDEAVRLQRRSCHRGTADEAGWSHVILVPPQTRDQPQFPCHCEY